jgi:hypothetical protein
MTALPGGWLEGTAEEPINLKPANLVLDAGTQVGHARV